MIRIYAALAAIAAVLAIGAALDRFTPVIGANARIAHFKAQSAAWRKAYAGWKAYGEAEAAAFRQSEALRARERSQAVSALNDAGKACSARVARARASAAAIHTLVAKEPPRDPQGCPLRALVDAGELRDAIDPAAR